MLIEADAIHARVTVATPDEVGWLRDYLKFEDPTARFTGRKPEASMFNEVSQSFPAGLLPLVRRASTDVRVKVEVLDRSNPAPVDPDADLAWLREDQRKGVQTAIARRRGLIWIPTAGGKTEIAIGIVRSVPSVRWLFLVHRAGLVDQAAKRFDLRTQEHGAPFERAGVVAEGQWTVGPLTCATFQTMHSALKRGDPRATRLLESAGGILVDEAHTIPADTFYAVIMQTPNAAYRIGVSGTPLQRGDRRSVLAISALGPVIYRITATELVEAGVVAKPHVRMVRCEQFSDEPDFDSVYKHLVIRSKRRNELVVEMAKRAEKPAVVFVKNLAHGRTLSKMLWAAGLRNDFVQGAKSTQARATLIKSLERGALDVLISTVVMQEGVDIPDLRSVVVASGGASVIAAIQRAGRGMRATSDKSDFTCWDVLDVGNTWLERHARERKRAFLNEKYETVVEGA